MVRNIDLPELLIFYGRQSMRGEGLESLLDECRNTDTAVLCILDISSDDDGSLPDGVSTRTATQPPPNPRDLWEALQSVQVQPRPFGGSSGFGRTPADPVREPLPSRTVVFCSSREETQAARACGIRVIALEDNDLADAVIEEIDLYLDDIATPGSFWLNPPHPRDDEGNRVDPEDVINVMEKTTRGTEEEGIQDDESRDDFDAILADMAPLRRR